MLLSLYWNVSVLYETYLSTVNFLVFFQMLWLGEDHLTLIKLTWFLSGVNTEMFQIVARVLEPHLTKLASIIPFLTMPVHVRYRFKCLRVQLQAVGFVACEGIEFGICLQENGKDVCISDEGIHV
jgi:hypothetical protein